MSTQPVVAGNIPQWTFADRLRKIRRESGLSQKDFAEKIQAGAAALSAWEAGRAAPRDLVSLAKRLELAFGVPAVWTLGLYDEGPRPGDPGGGLVDECAIRDSNPEPADLETARRERASDTNVVPLRRTA